MVHLGPETNPAAAERPPVKLLKDKEVSGRAGHPSRRQVIALRGARFRCGV